MNELEHSTADLELAVDDNDQSVLLDINSALLTHTHATCNGLRILQFRWTNLNHSIICT